MTMWYNIGLFGIVCGHLVYFFRFGMYGPRKIWQPWSVQLADPSALPGFSMLTETSVRLELIEAMELSSVFIPHSVSGSLDECFDAY
jgi:hypothetical protein